MEGTPSHSRHSGLITGLCLFSICLLAASVRLFSVIKYESMIHEFDPWFNYRVTEFLSRNGFYETWNWFDSFTWYPLGRVVGGTMYPGLIFTAGTAWYILQMLRIPVHVQEVCVFTAPVFSAFTSLATFGLMKEIKGTGAGLVSAALIAVVPSYISRSVAGSYDLEAVAIFALVFVFYLYVKTLNTGRLSWATALFLGYLYMVASWGGYSFIANLLPMHCLACVMFNRVTTGLYVAYAPFVILGALACMNIPVIGFNAVLMSEHFASYIVFALLHAVLAAKYAKSMLSPRAFAAALRIVVGVALVFGSLVVLAVIAYVSASPTFGWTGRSLSLLDPTYASKYIPIIASVSEHQPPAWNSFFTDLHVAALFAPAGLFLCFRPLTDASLFLLLYGVTAVYFSGVMVRLMLVLAPAACCLSGLALSEVLDYLCASSTSGEEAVSSYKDEGENRMKRKGGGSALKNSSSKDCSMQQQTGRRSQSSSKSLLPTGTAVLGLISILFLLSGYFKHSVYISGEMYSAPSIVLQTRRGDGSIKVYDDFREGYAWLRYNTPADAKVASWWDYGYQTTGMANRTVIVDNNTWNNTHIATVGRAMASSEKKAWQIFRSLDVDYVFVVFGGLIGYPSDDINKFLWMVRIAGGVFPDIKEKDFLGEGGQYRVDDGMSLGMKDSLMYRLSYYRFAEACEGLGLPRGVDRVRNSEIGLKNFKLKYFEEVFTTEHWMMRIYKVLEEPARDPLLPNVHRSRIE